MNLKPEIKDTPAQLIAEYIALRDEKNKFSDACKEIIKESYSDPMEVIENKLLDALNQIGGDSLATTVGTAYKNRVTSVTVADQREFKRHIIGGELWDLIEWRPAKTAINDLVDNDEPLPPGLNRTVAVTVNVRRPTK